MDKRKVILISMVLLESSIEAIGSSNFNTFYNRNCGSSRIYLYISTIEINNSFIFVNIKEVEKFYERK